MRITNKVAKFGDSNDQRFYHESYDSYKEFYNKLMDRQNGLDKNQTIEGVFNNHSKDWLGVDSVEQAKNLLLNGWQQNVEKFKKEFKKNVDLINQEKMNKQISDIVGFLPIVPNALLGLPNSMINFKVDFRKSRILRFMVAIDRACRYGVDEIIKKMSKILAYVAAIERSGKYRCRVEIFFTSYSDWCESHKLASLGILVKSENQLFDIKRLCFPIIHPAMLRLFSFSWFESLPEADSMRVGGYGTAFEHWGTTYKQDFINMVREGNEKVICLDLLSNMEDIIKKEVI